jgi:hypothetical protein
MDRRRLIAAAGAMTASPALAAAPALPILELRQYTLYGGKRDVLIDLFERYFIEPQEALGGLVLGTFRDLDDPDRFVWLRAFTDMAARAAMEERFYLHEPAWLAHKAAANATMVDSDNVLLLHAVGTPLALPTRRPAGVGVVRIEIRQLREVDPASFATFFDAAIAPRIAACGGRILARYVSETSPNTFPRLPVREHEPVFVWLSRFVDAAAEARFDARLSAQSGWRDHAPETVLPALMRKPERLRLSPTARSPLR